MIDEHICNGVTHTDCDRPHPMKFSEHNDKGACTKAPVLSAAVASLGPTGAVDCAGVG